MKNKGGDQTAGLKLHVQHVSSNYQNLLILCWSALKQQKVQHMMQGDIQSMFMDEESFQKPKSKEEV